MNNAQPQEASEPHSLESVIAAACRAIAPNWPLDRQIAVNPYWGFVDQPFTQVAATLRRLVGARFALEPGEYLHAWHSGEITPAALARAIAESGVPVTVDSAVAALQTGRTPAEGLPLPSDLLDRYSASHAGPRWKDTIAQQVSQYCASYFDEQQADWHRARPSGLYAGWRAALRVDHALEPLMQAPEIRVRTGELPDSYAAAIEWALHRLGVPAEQATEFLRVCLLRINGWAAWCAYLGWLAGLAGTADTNLRELLAIRCCWEALLHDGRGAAGSAGAAWREQWARALDAPAAPLDAWDLIWQRAQEICYQDRLIELLRSTAARSAAAAPGFPPVAQVAFCIDVRSERFRRALEATDPAIETRGFAGFFGLPIQYRPIGTEVFRPQLPGLLAPSFDVSETTGRQDEDAAIAVRRRNALRAKSAWQTFLRSPTGAFALVETLGLGYAGAILRRHFRSDATSVEALALSASDARTLRPQLALVGRDAVGRKADLAAAILRAMSLTTGFAQLLVLVGHGSQSANNPQAAALDCGACGGQSGEINARVLAGLLNDPDVRAALAERGIAIPAETLVIAALHNTTTDEVALLDIDHIPAGRRRELQRLQGSLAEAGHRTRAERAPDLGLGHVSPDREALLRSLRQRARDWAETRPEWGLANNAVLVVAPRFRTRDLDLRGRSFLHDYVAADDPDGSVLELIMTAPMVVAHWINMQYFASTVDPGRFGSGNKVLHNVACGRIGVFEGNTGDLRVGLSRQSLHDGERWMHTPMRLSVVIDAAREKIDAVLARHASVRGLVANQWLHLFRFAGHGVEWHRDGRWQPWTAGSSAP